MLFKFTTFHFHISDSEGADDVSYRASDRFIVLAFYWSRRGDTVEKYGKTMCDGLAPDGDSEMLNEEGT